MTLLDDIDDGDLGADTALLREKIPGYDYRVREARAETDRKVREKLRRDLGDATAALDGATDALYRRDDRDAIETVDRLKSDVETLRQRISTAAAGGGSVRDLVVEERAALVRLVEYDASLIEDVEAVVARADDVRDAVEAGEPVGPAVRECEAAVSDLDRRFERRQDYMEGLRE